jgi:NAD(P)H-dependent FMN reductase
LDEFDFPMMEERLRFRDDPPPGLVEFSEKIARADSVVIVTPEYNNGYPGVLKNALDYLLPEYKRKPIGIVTVSAGGFGGINCLAQLRLVTLGMGAFPIPAALTISRVQDSFDLDGNPFVKIARVGLCTLCHLFSFLFHCRILNLSFSVHKIIFGNDNYHKLFY